MRSVLFAGCLTLISCGGAAVPARNVAAPPAEATSVPVPSLPRVTPAPPVPGSESGVEAFSLFGEPLVPPPLPAEVVADREKRLAEARAAAQARPDSADAQIWLGRRIAYLGRYREAIDVYTRALEQHPDDARLLRHRGHRYLSLRRFDLAIADLQRAARLIEGKPDEVEPDGLPNAKNIPTSTLQSNIWYHLGLAHYLVGDLESAERAYREAMKVSKNPDMLVATTHWLYMTLRRLGRAAEAEELLGPIRNDMDILENRAYHWLVLMYKGEISPESILTLTGEDQLDPATLGYGMGNWHLYNGRRDEAVKAYRQVIAAGQWSAFGHLAAEADLKRLGVAPR